MRANFDKGFTYLGLLFIITILGITLAMAGTLWTFVQKREKERELLFIGNQFRLAIKLYYEKSPGVVKRYPIRLEQLLEDDRYVSLQRYLRRIYTDPITGYQDWGVVLAPEGGIMGIYSKSDLPTVKTGNFGGSYFFLENNTKYSDWKFVYLPIKVTTKK